MFFARKFSNIKEIMYFVILKREWEGMTDMAKVLVLGGTRFFGKRLVEKLLQDNHEVTKAKELGFQFNRVKTNINAVLKYYIEKLR